MKKDDSLKGHRNWISRRSIISAAASAAVAAQVPKISSAADGRTKLSAVLHIDGKNVVFREEGGKDRGTYVGEFVRQRSIEATNPELPMFTVLFRTDPDTNPSRDEVIVELGRCWNSEVTPAHWMRPYSVSILRGDRLITKINAPYHWWRARWRWQSKPRPVVREPRAIKAKNWIPPLGTPAYGTARASPTGNYRAPMDTAGIQTAMAMAGDRVEIGEVTEAQADYIVTGSPTALATLLAHGEACGTMPIHFRDEKTGAQVDLGTYPNIGIFKEHPGSPTILDAPMPTVAGVKAGSMIHDPRYFWYDTAHTPAAAALPFMLTDDPYFLEELEGQGFWAIACNPFSRHVQKEPLLANPLEDRSTAWSLRNLFQLAALAPAKPPTWLKSRAYWQRIVDANRSWCNRFVNSPAKLQRIFRMCPRSDMGDSWQRAFLCCAVAQGVLMGQKEWLRFFQWIVHTHIVMTRNSDGWNRQFPAPYEFYPLKTWQQHQFITIFPDGNVSLDPETMSSWGELFASCMAKKQSGDPNLRTRGNWDPSTWDGHTLMNVPWGYAQYHTQVRAALLMGVKVGVSEAKAGFDYLNTEIPRVPDVGKTWQGYRWSYVL